MVSKSKFRSQKDKLKHEINKYEQAKKDAYE